MRAHYEEHGLTPPDDFFPPDLLPGASLYLDAFNRLKSDRPVAIGFAGLFTGQIPYVSIERYAARNGIEDVDEFARFERVLQALDIPDVIRINEKANKQPGS